MSKASATVVYLILTTIISTSMVPYYLGLVIKNINKIITTLCYDISYTAFILYVIVIYFYKEIWIIINIYFVIAY